MWKHSPNQQRKIKKEHSGTSKVVCTPNRTGTQSLHSLVATVHVRFSFNSLKKKKKKAISRGKNLLWPWQSCILIEALSQTLNMDLQHRNMMDSAEHQLQCKNCILAKKHRKKRNPMMYFRYTEVFRAGKRLSGSVCVYVCVEVWGCWGGISKRSTGSDLGTRRSERGKQDGKMQSCIPGLSSFSSCVPPLPHPLLLLLLLPSFSMSHQSLSSSC